MRKRSIESAFVRWHMSLKLQINIQTAKVAEFCRRDRIRELSLFGSVLRDDFRPDSDVDVLVDFEADDSTRSSILSGWKRN